MKTFASILVVLAMAVTFAHADICLPKKPTVAEKLGRGFANIIFSPAELADSTFEKINSEGMTVGATSGFTQGLSRTLMDMAVGVFEVATFWYPSESMKFPAHDTLQVNPYPPADLVRNWY